MIEIEDVLGGCLVTSIVLLILCIPAWLTHIVVTIMNEQWILLVAGAIFFPIGIVHGWGIWFGVW